VDCSGFGLIVMVSAWSGFVVLRARIFEQDWRSWRRRYWYLRKSPWKLIKEGKIWKVYVALKSYVVSVLAHDFIGFRLGFRFGRLKLC